MSRRLTENCTHGRIGTYNAGCRDRCCRQIATEKRRRAPSRTYYCEECGRQTDGRYERRRRSKVTGKLQCTRCREAAAC